MPNRTFWFALTGLLGRATVHILGTLSWAKTPMQDQTSPILEHNRTFLVPLGSMSGEFGRVMVCILARRSPYNAILSRHMSLIRRQSVPERYD